MIKMKTLPPNEYVRLINHLNERVCAGASGLLVTYTVSGVDLGQRTHLKVPRHAVSASASSIIELRRRGIFCFPILAPLEGAAADLTPYRSAAVASRSRGAIAS